MANPIHKPDYVIFREMLTAARLNKGLHQHEIAEVLGKTQSYVSKYERGERRLDVIEFLDVAKALDINVIIFLKQLGKERKKKPNEKPIF